MSFRSQLLKFDLHFDEKHFGQNKLKAKLFNLKFTSLLVFSGVPFQRKMVGPALILIEAGHQKFHSTLSERELSSPEFCQISG